MQDLEIDAVTTSVRSALPRIRAAGMNVWGWLLSVLATRRIGFLPVTARLMYLSENAPQDGALR